MKSIFTFILLLLTISASAQKKKTYFPAWTFQQKNANIYGLSVGLWNFAENPKRTTSNGLRLSLIGEGILVAWMPASPIPANDSAFLESKKEPYSERINGLNISGTGTAGAYDINGISIGVVGHAVKRVNGISVSTLNFALQHNGIQLGIFVNESYKMRGIQLGAFNKSSRTKGIQIGFWNVNEKRKLPLINWNF